MGKIVITHMSYGNCDRDTFGILNEWHTTYTAKGVVILDIVNFHNEPSKWDEARGQLTSAERADAVGLAGEANALEKYASVHGLRFPIAAGVQAMDSHVGVFDFTIGRPTMAVFDRKGKLQMIRVYPHYRKHLRDIATKIVELIGQP